MPTEQAGHPPDPGALEDTAIAWAEAQAKIDTDPERRRLFSVLAKMAARARDETTRP